MEIYRYLFAPVLLAVALSLGHHHRRPVPPQETPAATAPAPVRPAADRPAPAHPRVASPPASPRTHVAH